MSNSLSELLQHRVQALVSKPLPKQMIALVLQNVRRPQIRTRVVSTLPMFQSNQTSRIQYYGRTILTFYSVFGRTIAVQVGVSEYNAREVEFSDRVRQGISHTFHVHPSVLCKSSDFFKAATKPEWIGPEPRAIDLSTENVDVFHMYLQWLYSGKIAVRYILESEQFLDYRSLTQCYLLGERLMDMDYCNAVMRMFMLSVKDLLTVDAIRSYVIRTIYDETAVSSPARKFLVDAWIWGLHRLSTLEYVAGDNCVEFGNDLIRALSKQYSLSVAGRKEPPWVEKPEDYFLQFNKEGGDVPEKTKGGN